jgi:hypothetical protein
MILGAIMLNRGLAVTGTGVDFNTLVARVSQKLTPTVAETPICDTEQTINMEVLKSRFSPNQFTLRKGIPVKWVIEGKEMNECNKTIVIPQYKMKIELKEGKQIIEFTPPESGVVPWSCWMGMIPGTFIVVDDVASTKKDEAPAIQPAEEKYPVIEAYRQRVVHDVRQLWQRLESFYEDVWAGK